ncbi:hypothetical protein LGN22_34100 [Burkholderia cenocepacia]|uniref:Uncharacterized protein n=1 Tax=Burkholderia cenocepacia TaxID=95486 RepID=A0AAW4TQ87_9BURK|nr:hypothetical protein [Burkholderia cenocepacia]MCA8383957.1 hypothetical protein [Burkholderia cenocepacia]
MNEAERCEALERCVSRHVCRIAGIPNAKARRTGSRQMTNASSPRLQTLDIDTVVRRMQHHPGDIVFEQRVSIPEAEVLCCRYEGERFNVKFDLDYGVFVERVGMLSRQDTSGSTGAR